MRSDFARKCLFLFYSEVAAIAGAKVTAGTGAAAAAAGVAATVAAGVQVIVVVVFFACLSDGCNAAEPQKDCIFLTQSQPTAGAYKTTLTPNAIKMERLGSKLFLIAKAPTWRVVFYNPSNNRAIELSLAQWLRHSECWTPFAQPTVFDRGDTAGSAARRGSPGAGSAGNGKAGIGVAGADNVPMEVVVDGYYGNKPVLIGSVTYCGQSCSRYGTPNQQVGKTIDPKHRYKEEIYACANKDIPKPELQILQKMYQIPPVEGIPVFCAQTENNNVRHEGAGDPGGLLNLFLRQGRLSTSSFIRGHVGDSDLNYPQHFQKVLKECDVMLDSSAQNAGDATSELFGIDNFKSGSRKDLKR
jgi:hypothetical protein